MRTLLILAAFLAGCASQPRVREFPDAFIVDNVVYARHSDTLTPEQAAAVAAKYSVPVFDDRERAMWRHLLIGHGLDVGTTVIGLNRGCVETLPGIGASPSIGVLIAVKAIPLVIWRMQANASPAGLSTADRLVSKINVVTGYGASALNLATIARGCVG